MHHHEHPHGKHDSGHHHRGHDRNQTDCGPHGHGGHPSLLTAGPGETAAFAPAQPGNAEICPKRGGTGPCDGECRTCSNRGR
jgi:hypothetical protein